MKHKVVVPMHPSLEAMETGRQKIFVEFPQRCVYCDGPVDTFQLIDVSGGKTVGKRSSSFSTQLAVPYCLDHSIVFNNYKRLMKIVGLPIFLIIFLGWFGIFFVLDPITEVLEHLPGINIIFIPLAFPCIGNFIVAFLSLLLLHGLLLLIKPIFREIPFFSADGGLGIKIKMNAGMYTIDDLTFSFTNKNYAQEFADANNVPFQ